MSMFNVVLSALVGYNKELRRLIEHRELPSLEDKKRLKLETYRE